MAKHNRAGKARKARTWGKNVGDPNKGNSGSGKKGKG